MADLAWFSAMFLLFCSLPGILRQPLHLARKKGTFSVHVCLTILELASLEKKKKEEEEEERFSIFSNFVFFTSIKLRNQRTSLFEGQGFP